MAELHEELSEGPCGTTLPASRVSPTAAPNGSEQVPGLRRQHAWDFLPVFRRRGILRRRFLRAGHGGPRRGEPRFRIVAGPCRCSRARSFVAGKQLALGSRIDECALGKFRITANPQWKALVLQEPGTTYAKNASRPARRSLPDSGQVGDYFLPLSSSRTMVSITGFKISLVSLCRRSG